MERNGEWGGLSKWIITDAPFVRARGPGRSAAGGVFSDLREKTCRRVPVRRVLLLPLPQALLLFRQFSSSLASHLKIKVI